MARVKEIDLRTGDVTFREVEIDPSRKAAEEAREQQRETELDQLAADIDAARGTGRTSVAQLRADLNYALERIAILEGVVDRLQSR